MIRVALGRIAGAIPLLFGIVTILFVVMNLAPGDPVLLHARPGSSPETLDAIRSRMGLDGPLHLRYLRWMAGVLRGDFGVSLTRNEPVLHVIGDLLPNTMILGGAALLLAFATGIAIGTWQGTRPGTASDTGWSLGTLFLHSIPSFWLALMLILLFSLLPRSLWNLPWAFPVSGTASVDADLLSGWGRFKDRLAHLVLPTLSLGLVLAAGITRFVRSAVVEESERDHIRTARARGIPERTVVLRHLLPNALLPVVTLAGLHLPLLFSGTVFVEWVFAWPGMGKATVDAILQRDYPLVMATTLFFALLVVLGNLLADLLYAILDPRIRFR